MILKPIFDKRDFMQTNTQPPVSWTVDSMEWDVMGGPRVANLTPSGDDNALWTLASMLRCPVSIYDDKGRAPWFGYVSEVHIANAGGVVGVGYSLENMANRVACAYSFIEPGGTVVGERRTTEFSTYAFGTSTYGQKDYIVSVDGMTGENGTLTRDTYLARHRIPQGVAEAGGMRVSMVCRGWWDTMTWRLAQFGGSSAAIITTKLAEFIPAYGQFLTSAVLETTNTGTINPYKAGDTTAYDECAKLMAMGGSNGRRILVRVDNARRAIFYEEPAVPAAGETSYQMDKYGRIYDTGGVPLDPHMAAQAVGNYIRLRDVVGVPNDIALLTDPTLQFLEGLSWQDGVLVPEFRGDVNVRDIVKAKE